MFDLKFKEIQTKFYAAFRHWLVYDSFSQALSGHFSALPGPIAPSQAEKKGGEKFTTGSTDPTTSVGQGMLCITQVPWMMILSCLPWLVVAAERKERGALT